MITTRLKNILRFAELKNLHDFEALEKWQVKRLPEMGKITFKELCGLLEKENIHFCDRNDPSTRRIALQNGGSFFFYVRVSTMDEEASFIREGKTLILP